MMTTELPRWTSGTGKVLEVGDTVRDKPSTNARYTITRIVANGAGTVHVECYGGKPGHLLTRVFDPNSLIRCTTTKTKHDPNSHYRELVREVSNASKKHRRLR